MLNLTPASFEEFAAEAQRGNVVPVVRSVLADLQTPVGAFLRVAGDASHAFLLESIEGGEQVARYSFLGARPRMIVRARNNQTIVCRDGEQTVLDQRGADFIKSYFAGKKFAAGAGLAPLAGGAVGYLPYNAVRWVEPALEEYAAAGCDDAAWILFRAIVVVERVR